MAHILKMEWPFPPCGGRCYSVPFTEMVRDACGLPLKCKIYLIYVIWKVPKSIWEVVLCPRLPVMLHMPSPEWRHQVWLLYNFLIMSPSLNYLHYIWVDEDSGDNWDSWDNLDSWDNKRTGATGAAGTTGTGGTMVTAGTSEQLAQRGQLGQPVQLEQRGSLGQLGQLGQRG